MRRIPALIVAVMVSVALAACGSGVEPSSGGAGESTSGASESSVGRSSEEPSGSSSGPRVVEDPRWPAPVLVGWDPSLSVFGGSPPPVVFASLFDGRLPAVDPVEVGGFAHVVDEWSTVFSRARIYREQQDRIVGLAMTSRLR